MIVQVNFDDVQVGDEVEFLCNGRGRGGHYTVMVRITKKNRKTFDAVELPRSYRGGTLWRVHNTTRLTKYVG